IEKIRSLVGRPGIFIEKGIFQSSLVGGVDIDEQSGYIEILLTFPGCTELVGFGDTWPSLENSYLSATGYISWTWIFDQEWIDAIDERIASAGAESSLE